MSKYLITANTLFSSEEQKRRLAKAYALILSWPDPVAIETTDSVSDLGGEATEPVEETPAQNEQDA